MFIQCLLHEQKLKVNLILTILISVYSSSIYWYETYLHVYNHNNNIIANYNMITNYK